MPRVKAKAGRISEVLPSLRSDWSQLRAIIQALEPGRAAAIPCPDGITMGRLRSTVLTYGRRYHTGDWRLRTLTKGKVLKMFLEPV